MVDVMGSVITTQSHPTAFKGNGAAGPMPKAPSTDNLALEMDDYDLDRIGETVRREYKVDKDSRADWEAKNETALKLALQVAERKSYPWPGASNVKYPLITTGALQFAARAYPAIVPNQNVVKGKINGDDKGVPAMDEQGPVVDPETQEPQWEVEPGFKKEKAERIARHMSYQLLEEMEEWEEGTDKLLHILPIVGCCFRKTYWCPVRQRNVSKLVLPDDLVVHNDTESLATTPRITHKYKLYPHEIEERFRKGVYRKVELGLPPEASGDEQGPHEFLEQHRRLDLDDDGYEEPYIVTQHKETSQVVRIVENFDDETTERDGKKIVKADPITYFTKYPFVPNPDGSFYDIGLATLLAPINESVNTVLNQMLDAGHLQNVGGGLIGGSLGIKGGPLRLRPGEFRKVDVMGPKLKDNVVPFNHQGPSPVLFQLLGLLIEAGTDISSVKDVMTGEQGPAGEGAARMMGRIEQGMKMFTSIYKRVFRSLKKEYRLLFRLNRLYLQPESYFQLHDDPEAIAQEDYNDSEMDIAPVADPNMISDMQKLAKAEFLMPFLEDPYFEPVELRTRLLDAASIPDASDLLIQGPPPTDPTVAAEADKLEIEKERLKMEALKLEAELAEIDSKTILNLAKAEAAEEGSQLAEYKEEMALLKEGVRARNANQRGAVQGMAGPSGNAGGPQVSP